MEKFKIPSLLLRQICLWFLMSIPIIINAQSVKRQCISSFGAGSSINGTAINQTAGQVFSTSPAYSGNTSVMPGFQQAVSLKIGSVVIQDTTSIKLTAFPNPASNILTIQSNETLDNTVFKITDMNGKVIAVQNIEKFTSHELNCSSWKEGIYIIFVNANNKKSSLIKLIINR